MSRPTTHMLLGFSLPQTAARNAPEHARICLPGMAALATLPLPPTPPQGEARTGWETGLVLLQNAVLAAYVQAGDVLPARFGGFFSDLDTLRARASADHSRICQGLAHVAGIQEYGFKLRLTARGVAAPDLPRSGRDSMPSRLRAGDAGARLNADRQALREEAAGALAAVCRQILPGPPSNDLLMNLTLLADRAAAASLIGTAREVHDRAVPLGLSVTLSGPWPPYVLPQTPEPLREAGQ